MVSPSAASPPPDRPPSSRSPLRERLYIIIFEADTPAGRLFDLLLICCIIGSVITVMLDSVNSLRERHALLFSTGEWFFTLLFTGEYLLRLYCARDTRRYAKSFFGVVDFMSIIPTYIGLILPGAHTFLIIRTLRLLRIFRILKLANYSREAVSMMHALQRSRRRILVFLCGVLVLVTMLGSCMYAIEGPHNEGFSSIPKSVYWAVVTLTTVGYGDISPQTGMGQALATIIMILGYSIIAVPTGIVGANLIQHAHQSESLRTCPNCRVHSHPKGALYCHQCGSALPPGNSHFGS